MLVLVAKYESGYISKAVKDRIMQETLAPWLSASQIEFYFDKDRKFIKNPPESGISFAMQLRSDSKINTLDLVSTKIPMLSVSLLNQRFGLLHMLPGLIKVIVTFFL